MNRFKPLILVLVIGFVPSTTLIGTIFALSGSELSTAMFVCVAVTLTTILLAVIVGIFQIYRLGLKHEERVKMIETGNELRDEPLSSPEYLLLAGALALSFGLATLIAIFIPSQEIEFGASLALIFSGLSMILIYRRHQRR